MKVLFAAAECSPIAKVGGLGDVIGSLPKALKEQGVDVSVALPFYKPIRIKKRSLKKTDSFYIKKEKFIVWQGKIPKTRVPLYLIENKTYLSSGGIYLSSNASSQGGFKEGGRFLLFSRAVVELAKKIKPDILHCHDWHTATIPFLLEREKLPFRTILTIHNLAYQGTYKKQTANYFLETKFPGKINSLKLGIRKADFITTVSPTYAKEILRKTFGFGLEKELRKRRKNLFGILNGLDTEVWNPQKDKFIKAQYSVKTMGKKIINKKALEKFFFKKADPQIPLLSIVSRLAPQKGIDLIMKIMPFLLKEKIQLVILGRGNPEYRQFFLQMRKKYPEKVGYKNIFSEKLAHQIYAGADIFLMPSYFEPCGLGQQIAMRYGTIPVARAVGGIKDTVSDGEDGFLFYKYSANAFQKAIKKALQEMKTSNWKNYQKRAMEKDVSWQKSAKEYEKLYKLLEN